MATAGAGSTASDSRGGRTESFGITERICRRRASERRIAADTRSTGASLPRNPPPPVRFARVVVRHYLTRGAELAPGRRGSRPLPRPSPSAARGECGAVASGRVRYNTMAVTLVSRVVSAQKGKAEVHRHNYADVKEYLPTSLYLISRLPSARSGENRDARSPNRTREARSSPGTACSAGDRRRTPPCARGRLETARR